MAATQISGVVMEARAALEASHKLLDEMRTLRGQVHQGLAAVRNSTFTLAQTMNVNIGETALVDVLAGFPPESQAPVAVAPQPLVAAPGASDPPPLGLRPLDPKDQMGLDLLTPREIEVLRLIGEGQRTKEIAFALGITFKTAVTHRSNIMEKLGIHEGPRLVRFAIRTGITTA
jgi:DNA-binding CsgD family transcriptional regulator